MSEHSTERLIQETATRLAAELGDRAPLPEVVRTVAGARQDLEGQIVPEAIGEMLYRLAHHRLHSLPG